MDSAPSTAAVSPHWWSPRTLPESHTLHCAIGPLSLDIYRGGGEWRIAWSQGLEDPAGSVAALAMEERELDVEKMERHVFGTSSSSLRLRPKLLDKPVIIRPRQPIFLPPGEATTLYLSSPLCVSIEVSEPAVELREVATLRLSDTWFGPSTREGELGYAGKSHARHDLESLPRRPHRAITPVHIENHSSAKLPLEKLSLPVPALSVYGASDGSLWTQALSFIRTANTDHANMHVGTPPEAAAGALELLTAARKPAQRGGLVRAFGLLFGG